MYFGEFSNKACRVRETITIIVGEATLISIKD